MLKAVTFTQVGDLIAAVEKVLPEGTVANITFTLNVEGKAPPTP
jgi:hypothetical protein